MQTHTHIIPGILSHSYPLLPDTHSQGSQAQTPYMSKSSKAEDVKGWIWHQVGCVISNKKYIEPQNEKKSPKLFRIPPPPSIHWFINPEQRCNCRVSETTFFFFLSIFFLIFGICLALNCLISSHAIYCLFSSLVAHRSPPPRQNERSISFWVLRMRPLHFLCLFRARNEVLPL